jgi:hypothetical protein
MTLQLLLNFLIYEENFILFFISAESWLAWWLNEIHLVEAENELPYCPAVVCQLFLYPFICASTSACISKFCTLQLSSIIYLMMLGFISEGDLQFTKLFKTTILKGECTFNLNAPKNISPLLPSSISSHTEFKDSIIHLLKIIRLSAPLFST